MSDKKDIDAENRIINSLLAEYKICFDSYNYRDQLIVNEFQLGLLLVATLTTLLVLFSQKIGTSGVLMVFLIGILGLVTLRFSMYKLAKIKEVAGDRIKNIEQEVSGRVKGESIANVNNNKLVVKIGHDIFGYDYDKCIKKNISVSNLLQRIMDGLMIIWIIYIFATLYKGV